MRVYRELAAMLDRDAIVIGDGGDFVSYAGRVVDPYEPGMLARPGPVRLPGRRPGLCARGQARAPRSAGDPPAGDGAFGFSGMEFDTLARHGVNVVGVMGNNGIWALETTR